MRYFLRKVISVFKFFGAYTLLSLSTIGYTRHQVRSADFPPVQGGEKEFALREIICQCRQILDQNIGERYLTSDHLALAGSLLDAKQDGILDLGQFGKFKIYGSCFIPVNIKTTPPVICYTLKREGGGDALFFFGGLYALPLLLIDQRHRRLLVFEDSYSVQPKCPEIDLWRLVCCWRKGMQSHHFFSEGASLSISVLGGNILFFGFTNNFGHYLWNELSGLYDLIASGLLKRVSGVVVGPYDFCDVGQILSEQYGMIILPVPKDLSISSSPEAKGIFFRFNDIVVTDDYCRYLREEIFGSTMVAEELEKKRLNVCVKIRCHNRVCLNQGEVLRELIRYLLDRHGERRWIHLFIDGFSSYSTMTLFEKEMISAEKEYLDQLVNDFDTQWRDRVEVVDMIGMSVQEKAEIATVLDLYLSPVGSGGELYTWVYKVPAIYYGVPCMMTLSQRHNQGIVESLPWIALIEASPVEGRDDALVDYRLDPPLLLAAMEIYCDALVKGEEGQLTGESYFGQRSEQ